MIDEVITFVIIAFAVVGMVFTGAIIFILIHDYLEERKYHRKNRRAYAIKKVSRMVEKLHRKTGLYTEELRFNDGIALVVKFKDAEHMHISFNNRFGYVKEEELKRICEEGEGTIFVYGIGDVRIFTGDAR